MAELSVLATIIITVAGAFGVPTVLWLAKTLWNTANLVAKTALIQQQHAGTLKTLEEGQVDLRTDFKLHQAQSATIAHQPR